MFTRLLEQEFAEYVYYLAQTFPSELWDPFGGIRQE